LIGSTLAPGAVGTNIVNIFNSSVQEYLTLASGLILILVLILNPDGVTRANITVFRHLSTAARRMLGGRRLARPTGCRRWGPWRKRVDRTAAGLLETASRADVARMDLDVRDVTVLFGGVTALAEASLCVPGGKIVGLIGPNGAGKSTLIEVMSGFLAPNSGVIELGGRPLNKLSAERRARAGLGRTFQAAELFRDLTVRENLLVAGETGGAWQRIRDVFMPGRVGLTAGALAAISYFDLEEDLDSYPDELSYGRSRLVAIARAIAREPSVLLLDEPAAGLSESERGELAALIGELAHQHGVGVLLVEHDVELVMSTCDTVVALEFGRVIASGKPQNVRQNPDVIRAYLGEPARHTDHDGEAGTAAAAESVNLP
jgi:sulfate-transporting ATPase